MIHFPIAWIFETNSSIKFINIFTWSGNWCLFTQFLQTFKILETWAISLSLTVEEEEEEEAIANEETIRTWMTISSEVELNSIWNTINLSLITLLLSQHQLICLTLRRSTPENSYKNGMRKKSIVKEEWFYEMHMCILIW